jgi:heme exporter protein A
MIASDRPLWLLDEPANGLDGDGLIRLATVMAEARKAGRAIMAASHQPIGLGDHRTVDLS